MHTSVANIQRMRCARCAHIVGLSQRLAPLVHLHMMRSFAHFACSISLGDVHHPTAAILVDPAHGASMFTVDRLPNAECRRRVAKTMAGEPASTCSRTSSTKVKKTPKRTTIIAIAREIRKMPGDS